MKNVILWNWFDLSASRYFNSERRLKPKSKIRTPSERISLLSGESSKKKPDADFYVRLVVIRLGSNDRSAYLFQLKNLKKLC